MVKLIPDGRKTPVIVLGRAHDLSNNVPTDCEYTGRTRCAARPHELNGRTYAVSQLHDRQ